jgi:ActR/RegA family two-component response regulator
MEMPPSRTAIAGRKTLAGKVIVILEDDELVRRATERLLRRFGAEVVAGRTTAEVQEALSARGLAPDCVVADFWLCGEESGLAAAARLAGTAGGSLRTVIVTGDLSRETAEAVAGAGFHLLRKPVDSDRFLDALVREN